MTLLNPLNLLKPLNPLKPSARLAPAAVEAICRLPRLDILVFSDSHGQSDFMVRTVRQHQEAELVLHLGDHSDTLAELSLLLDKPLLGVAGNCDGFAGRHLPGQMLLEVAGQRLFLTHGHLFGVKHQLARLVDAAAGKPNLADIILFGHTHQLLERRLEWQGREVLLLNPGSARASMAGQPASAILLHLRPAAMDGETAAISYEMLLDQP